MEFFPEIPLDHRAAEAIARGLYAVAKVDGVHEHEEALIASFWLDTGGGAGALAQLERGNDITAAELAASLHGDEKMLFMKTAVLLAWADGKVSAEERGILGRFADALEINVATVEQLESEVKEFLLGHVAHLANTDATTLVAKQLAV